MKRCASSSPLNRKIVKCRLGWNAGRVCVCGGATDSLPPVCLLTKAVQSLKGFCSSSGDAYISRPLFLYICFPVKDRNHNYIEYTNHGTWLSMHGVDGVSDTIQIEDASTVFCYCVLIGISGIPRFQRAAAQWHARLHSTVGDRRFVRLPRIRYHAMFAYILSRGRSAAIRI